MITIDDYFRDPQTGADRRETYKDDYKPEYLDNANKLLKQVNGLLAELGVPNQKVSSGWRPLTVNKTISNAAKKSYHMSGLAVDLHDDQAHTLGHLILNRPDLLKKYNLWLENLGSTPGWTHLDLGTRSDRPVRMFKP